jgi:hypothetical protein
MVLERRREGETSRDAEWNMEEEETEAKSATEVDGSRVELVELTAEAAVMPGCATVAAGRRTPVAWTRPVI